MPRSDRDVKLAFPCPLCGNALSASVCVLDCAKPYVMDIEGCEHALEYSAGIANDAIVEPIDRAVIGALSPVDETADLHCDHDQGLCRWDVGRACDAVPATAR